MVVAVPANDITPVEGLNVAVIPGGRPVGVPILETPVVDCAKLKDEGSVIQTLGVGSEEGPTVAKGSTSVVEEASEDAIHPVLASV